ncbi:MAG: ferredoxin family protein [Oscillospiraceae bacterium]
MEPCKQAPAPRVEDKLGKNKFHTDEHHSHIDVDKEYGDGAELEKVIKACPAALYKLDENGTLFFDYLGCLECGTCRVLSGGRVIKDWQYPKGSLGVEFRMG